MEDDIDISDPIYLQVSRDLRIILKYNYEGEKLDIFTPDNESYTASTISIYDQEAVDAFFSKNGKSIYCITKNSETGYKTLFKVGEKGKIVGKAKLPIIQNIFLK